MTYEVRSSKTAAVNDPITVPINGTDPNNQTPATTLGNTQTKHMFTIDPGNSTAGTITVTAKVYDGPAGETVFESDGLTPVSIDLSDANKSFTRKMEGYSFESITFSASGMNGSSDWKASVSSGD